MSSWDYTNVGASAKPENKVWLIISSGETSNWLIPFYQVFKEVLMDYITEA